MDRLPALIHFAVSRIFPHTGRQVDIPLELIQMEDRRHEVLAAPHVLILQLPARLVLRELIEHRADERRAVLGCLAEQIADVVMHPDADVIVLLHDPEVLLAVAPQLVRLAGVKIAAAPVAGVERRDVVRTAVAVHAHNRAEHRKFIPADQQLLPVRIVHIVRHEAADIRVPPRNSGESDVDACLHLIVKRLECTRHVAAPQNIAVLLTSSPAAAQQIHHLPVPQILHLVIENAAVHLRIQVTAGECRSLAVAIVFKIIDAVVRLGVVEPECVDSQIVIILFADIPDILSRLRIERINLDAVSLIVVRLRRAALRADQQSLLHHGRKILALPVDTRPHGNHDLDSHRVQLVDHRFRIRPVRLVEFPVSLHRPMEEVDDDLIDFDAFLLILAGDGQHLVLRAVAQLALPQSHSVLREHRRPAHHICVLLQDLLRRVRHRDPVVHLLSRPRDPLSVDLAERDLPDRRIVPQHAVTLA